MFCSKIQAEMVLIESEAERKEIAELLKTLLKGKWRFWVRARRVQGLWKTNKGNTLSYTPWWTGSGWRGDCLRVGGNLKYTKAACTTSGALGGFTFNPFCKKPISEH